MYCRNKRDARSVTAARRSPTRHRPPPGVGSVSRVGAGARAARVACTAARRLRGCGCAWGEGGVHRLPVGKLHSDEGRLGWRGQHEGALGRELVPRHVGGVLGGERAARREVGEGAAAVHAGLATHAATRQLSSAVVRARRRTLLRRETVSADLMCDAGAIKRHEDRHAVAVDLALRLGQSIAHLLALPAMVHAAQVST
jgi:hypothetical protein